jgi:hypothetical protein
MIETDVREHDDAADEFARQLKSFTSLQTAGSRPWPQLNDALRRSNRHRRTVRGVAVLAAAAVVAVGAIIVPSTLSTSGHGRSPGPAGRTHDDTRPLATATKDAGYGANTVGSLSQDTAFLAQLRKRAVPDQAVGGGAPEGDVSTSTPETAVVAAGDYAGGRYAVMVSRVVAVDDVDSKHVTTVWWGRGVLYGKAGAAASTLQSTGWDFDYKLPADLTYTFGMLSRNSFIAVDPNARKIELAAERHLYPDGRATTRWAPLTDVGNGLWLGKTVPGQVGLPAIRKDGSKVDYDTDSLAVPDFNLLPVGTYPPDGFLASLSSDMADKLGLTGQETAEYAHSVQLDNAEYTLSTGLARSPDGAQLYCIEEDANVADIFQACGIADQKFSGPDQVMAALATANGARLTVFAPSDATTVKVASIVVDVQHRIAHVLVPKAAADQHATVQAFDKDGKLIDSVQATPPGVQSTVAIH